MVDLECRTDVGDPAVVIDLYSSELKIGFSGEDHPRFAISNLVGVEGIGAPAGSALGGDDNGFGQATGASLKSLRDGGDGDEKDKPAAAVKRALRLGGAIGDNMAVMRPVVEGEF